MGYPRVKRRHRNGKNRAADSDSRALGQTALHHHHLHGQASQLGAWEEHRTWDTSALLGNVKQLLKVGGSSRKAFSAALARAARENKGCPVKLQFEMGNE